MHTRGSTERLRRPALALSAIVALLALSAAAQTPADRSRTTTLKLRIGVIPFDKPVSPSEATDADKSLNAYFAEVGRRFQMDARFDLDVIPVKGNYYQVAQWLREGLVDGAVVSSFSAHLLTTDRSVAVFPVAELSRNASPPAADATVPATVAARFRGENLARPEIVFKDCLTAARQSLQDPTVAQRCELRFVGHLSTTGFVVPLLYIEEFVRRERMKPKEEALFWTRVFEWSRFEFWHDAELPEPTDKRVIRFTYKAGWRRGEPLTMNARIPSLNDVLLLGHKRRVPTPFAVTDEGRREALMREAPDVFVTAMLRPSMIAPGTPNMSSPWIAAGAAMQGVAPKPASLPAGVVTATPPPGESWRGYRSTSAWNEESRREFARILDGVLRPHQETPLGLLARSWYAEGEYAFTIDELIGLLQADQVIRNAPRAALVLPGGGVRATYQAVILDYLYARHLVNSGRYVTDEAEPRIVEANSEATNGRLVIKGIAGTSGGALLGYMASRRDTLDTKELTKKWIDGEVVKTKPLDIFPPLGIFRWMSFIVLLTVFAATAAVHLSGSKVNEVMHVPFWYTSLLSVVVIAMPFLIWRRAINDPGHVTVWESAAIVLMILVAHCVHSTTVSGTARPSRYRLLPLGLIFMTLSALAAWLLVVLTPVSAKSVQVFGETTAPWAIYSAAVALVMIAGLSVIAAWTGARVCPEKRTAYLESWLVLLLLVLLTFAVFFVGWELGHVTPLEMTLDYWVWLFIGGLFASKIIVTAGRMYADAPLQRGIRFLTEPSGTAPFPYTPTISLVIWGGITIAVWVLSAAPALYTSSYGQEAFAKAIDPNSRERTPLIVSMTAFGKAVPGYQLYPAGDYYACRDWWVGIDEPNGGTSAQLFRMPPDAFQTAVFASGSAFPVYPAAKVDARDGLGLFLDGGFAHRVPIEGAGLVQAAQILVVENSAKGLPEKRSRASTLITNLGGGFQYLFARSQTMDLQQSKRAVVGTISPDWTGPNPFLMDFRESVVRRLRDEAEGDLHGHRVARIVSWGEPAPPVRGSGR